MHSSQSDLSQRFIVASSSKNMVDEAEVTLLKEQLSQLERSLLEEAKVLSSEKTELEKQANRVRAGRLKLNSKLKPQALAENALEMQALIEESRDCLKEEPIILDEESQSHLNASAGEVLLAAKGNKEAFYTQKQSKDREAETAQLQALAENQELKTCVEELARKTQELETEAAGLYEALANNQALAKGLVAENRQLKQELKELEEHKAEDDDISAQILQKQLQVVADNKRLIENLEEDNRRYLVLEAESRLALDAKKEAEASKAWAMRNLEETTTKLQETERNKAQLSESFELKKAEILRLQEALVRLKADLGELGNFAEQLQKERDEYYAESQYGYMKQKCDQLQRKEGALVQRAREAERAVKEIETQCEHLRHNNAQLKSKVESNPRLAELEAENRGLAQENMKLQEEIKRAKAKPILLNDLERQELELGRGALIANQRLQKELSEVHERNKQLEAVLAEKCQVRFTQEAVDPEAPRSKLADVIKLGACTAGLALIVVGGVAAAGLMGAAIVTFGWPLIVAGLVVAGVGAAVSNTMKRKPGSMTFRESLCKDLTRDSRNDLSVV